jgi:hypothetical protein
MAAIFPSMPLAVGLEMRCRRCAGWHPLFDPEPGGERHGGPEQPMLYYHCPPGSNVLYYAGSEGEISTRAVRRPQERI